MNLSRPVPRLTLLTPITTSTSTSPPSQCLAPRPYLRSQVRHAHLIRRPLRPYTFTQLVTLSDGSTYTHRTTSPSPLYISRKDTRNTPMWNPSSQKLMNVEADEAGKLRRFREKFGRGWDATASGGRKGGEGDHGGAGEVDGKRGVNEYKEREVDEGDNLMDLISGYGREAEGKEEAAGLREEKARSGKGKGGER